MESLYSYGEACVHTIGDALGKEKATWWTLLVLGVVFDAVVSYCHYLDEAQPQWWKQREVTYGKPQRHKLVNPGKLQWVYIQNYIFSGFALVCGWMLRVALFGHKTPLQVEWENMTWFMYLSTQLIVLLVINFVSQTWFYHAHRFVHSVPQLYNIIHKMHHEYTEPVAAEAIYCTKTEMVLLNLMAVVIGPWILLPPSTTTAIWYASAAIYVPLAHGGHEVCSMFSAAYHDAHHKFFTVNYGSQFWDAFYHTQVLPEQLSFRQKQHQI